MLKTMCNGLSTLNRVGIEHEYNRCSSNYVDMLSIISELWEKFKFSFVKEHVLAH